MGSKDTLNSKDIRVVVLMGVSGSGKTTIGHLLAQALGWQFADGDDYHSAANKAKMHSGHPLTDEDRKPWLATLAEHISEWSATGKKTVLACSALKSTYRDILVADTDKDRVALVYLKADFETIAGRLNARTGHFMNKDLLRSQFDTLEEPAQAHEEPVIEVDASLSEEQVVAEITDKLKSY